MCVGQSSVYDLPHDGVVMKVSIHPGTGLPGLCHSALARKRAAG